MHLIGQLTMSPWSWDLYCSCTSLPVRCHATRIQDQQQMYHHILYLECSRCHHSIPIFPSIICIRQEWKRERTFPSDITTRRSADEATTEEQHPCNWRTTTSGGRTEEMEMEKEPTTSLLICVVNSALCCTPPQTTLDLWEWYSTGDAGARMVCQPHSALLHCLYARCCCCCCWWLCGGGGWWLTIKMIPRKYFITLVTTLKIAFGT